MKNALVILLALAIFTAPAFARGRHSISGGKIYKPRAASPVRVKGYLKKNGTYVAPHIRTKPNKTKIDNYSSKGNVNPATGKPGSVDSLKP
jgi:hypothetical protein